VDNILTPALASPNVWSDLTQLLVAAAAAASSPDYCWAAGTVRTLWDSSQAHVVNDELLRTWLQAAQTVPELLLSTSVVDHVVSTSLELAARSDTTTRLLASEILVVLLSHEPANRALIMSLRPVVSARLIPTLTEIMVTGLGEDVSTWMETLPTLDDDEAWNDDETDADQATLLLELLVLQVGGQVALPTLAPILQQFMSGTDWRWPHAGLAILLVCWQCCPVSFAPHHGQALQTVLAQASSPHPRIHYQVLRVLGAQCEAQGAAPTMLSTLVAATGHECPRVAAMACRALVSYCRSGMEQQHDDDKDWIAPYASNVLQALCSGPLSRPQQHVGWLVVQIRAMGAVACLATALQSAFLPFYAAIVPNLLDWATVAATPTGSSYAAHVQSAWRSAALEAVTIIGQAVGDEAFLLDAQRIMTWARPHLNMPPFDGLLAACARIASVVPQSYQLADVVVPLLLERAAAENGISVEVSFFVSFAENAGMISKPVCLVLYRRGMKRPGRRPSTGFPKWTARPARKALLLRFPARD
jgi:hypothetical protein